MSDPTVQDSPAPETEDDGLQAIEYFAGAYKALRTELAKVIVGQELVIDELLIAIFTRSHALLVGVPGLAKTLLISTLSQALQLSFKRIQFTPDLMPSDITGTEVIYQDPATNERQFKFLHGPIFANVILADEINRTPPNHPPRPINRPRSTPGKLSLRRARLSAPKWPRPRYSVK